MPSVAVNAPKTPVTKGSNGIAMATVPNVCKVPGPPAPFVPTPLPNIGKSGSSPKDYSKKVKIEGKPVAIRGASFGSQGDMASKGTGGGLVSANTHGPTKFIGPGSLNVRIEGKNVQLLGDPMLNNCGPSGSPPNAATLAGVIQGIATPEFGDKLGDKELADEMCTAACKSMHEPEEGTTRQHQMAREFAQPGEKKGEVAHPWYQAKDNRLVPEVSQKIPPKKGDGMTTLMSRSSRTMPDSGVTAPRSMMASLRESTPDSPVTRWDFVIPSKNGSCKNNHIQKYIEVKFPHDTLTDNQRKARERMSKAELDKVVDMEPAVDCTCKKDEKVLKPPK